MDRQEKSSEDFARWASALVDSVFFLDWEQASPGNTVLVSLYSRAG